MVVGSRYAVSNNGWIDQELFFYWLSEHFLVNAVAASPFLLLLDGYSNYFEPTTISLAESSDYSVCHHTLHMNVNHSTAAYSAPSSHNGNRFVMTSTKKILER